MANKRLFGTNTALLAPPADAVNEAGGRAYALSPRHALAQYAATGCLNATFYASAEQQLATLLALCEQVTPEFIAKTAVYCRERGLMKDVPALLCAVLAVRDTRLLAQIFPRVIDDARMLRNFVQILRSGQLGRRSLGTAPKRLVREWLAARTEEQLSRAAVGRDPSLADIVKMVHPRPATPAREALYAYLIGKAGGEAMALLPEAVQRFESFKGARAAGENAAEPPDVPFQMLTALNLSTADWTAIARRATWQQVRLNLNTFARHGVFEVEGMAELVAAKLSDEQAIARARVFPYQLLAAYQAAGPEIPVGVRHALHAAMEVATRNVPALSGKVYILLDVCAGERLAQGRDHEDALHRRGGADRGGDPAHEPAGRGDRLQRQRGRGRASRGAAGDGERRAARRAAGRRHQLLGAAGTAEPAPGRGRPGDLRLRHGVVDGPLGPRLQRRRGQRRHGHDARVAGAQGA